MYFHIAEVGTAKATGLMYLLVRFWRSKADHDAGKRPRLTNDFLMQLRPTGRRIVTRADGWLKLLDGTFVNPEAEATREIPGDQFERETYTVDVRAQIVGNIRRYWQEAKAAQLSGDHTGDATKPLYRAGQLVAQRPTPAIARDLSDPHRILERADVDGLRDAKVEAAG